MNRFSDSLASQDPSQLIYDSAQRCLALFDTLQLSRGTESSLLAQELCGRFKQWAAYIGAFADQKASLDTRLIRHEDIRDMVLELLYMIRANVEWAHHIDVTEDGVDPDTGLPAVEVAIDRLLILAVELRRSARRIDRFRGGRRDAQDESLCCLLIKTKYPNARTSLCDQLGASIYLRGSSLKYMKEHNEKLAHQRGLQEDGKGRVTKDNGKEEKPLAALGAIKEVHPTSHTCLPGPETLPSTVTPSNISGVKRAKKIPTSTIISTGSTSREDSDDVYDYPPQPKPLAKERYRPCTICATPLDLLTLNQRIWSFHVDQDLEPYICISEDCMEPLQYFSTFQSWSDHMQTRHLLDWSRRVHTEMWFCDFDHPELLEFDEKTPFADHLKSNHIGKLTQSQLQGRLRRNRRIATRDPFVCPLCDCIPQSIKQRINEKPYKALWEHIGDHLKSISLLSLSHIAGEIDESISVKASVLDEVEDVLSISNASWDNRSVGNFDNIPETKVYESHVQVEDQFFEIGEPLQELEDWGFLPVSSLETDWELLAQRLGGSATRVTLGQRLRTHGTQHPDESQGIFLPVRLLREIITKQDIQNALRPFHSEHLTDLILPEEDSGAPEYIKILAILALIGKEKRIGEFLAEGLCDKDLPLVLCEGAEPSEVVLAKKRAPDVELNFFSHWKLYVKDAFLRTQYAVNVAFLSLEPDGRSIQHVDFEPEIVMPWTSIELQSSGGYAQVFKVNIHPYAHGFHEVIRSITTDHCFALKKLISFGSTREKKTDAEFRHEIEMSTRFSGFIHPHLVTLLMSFTYRNQKYFLFPFAQHDLDSYWLDPNTWSTVCAQDETTRLSTMRWISKQIVGMTDALESLHYPRHLTTQEQKFARHGDLKPENVLWYRSPRDKMGILVIADLGLTALNSDKSCSNVPSRDIPRTPSYRPPECDIEGGTISRLYDIWTFGCLLLEFVCWVLGGNSLRRVFEDERWAAYITGSQSEIFFDVKVKENGNQYVILVKESVHRRISLLHGHERCTQYLHDMLDLIEEEMIIVLSATRSRIRSKELLEKVKSMHEKVIDPRDPHGSYCMTPCPEERSPRRCVPVDAILNPLALGMVRRYGTALLSTHRGATERMPYAQEQQFVINMG